MVHKVHYGSGRDYSRDGGSACDRNAGHPEVERTHGQYEAANGGAIYLVEMRSDVAKLMCLSGESGLRHADHTSNG